MPKFGNGCKPELGEYCMGGCEGRGFCRPSNNEGECSMLDLVCTCAADGMVASTGTRCTVNRNNIDTYSACDDWISTPQDCGGPNNVECPEGQKCNITNCATTAWGLCTDTPVPDDPCGFGCLSGGLFGNPECGCDGVTYASACHRRQADIAKDPSGSCTDTDTPQAGNSCNPSDLTACDNSSPTYCMGNGTDGGFIFDQMECTPSFIQSQNGCPPGLNCWRQYPKTLFCKRPYGDCEGTSGTCTHWPGSDVLGCSIFGEVISCGCDGVTYSHECYAYIEEVGIDHYQACEVIDAGQSFMDAGHSTDDNNGQSLIDAGGSSNSQNTDSGSP
jgi:hypothetical protein